MRENADCCVELASNERRLGGLLYDLTFVNVTKDDAQVIQCNISNKHGYNFTNAYINVYSEYHPVFSQCTVLASQDILTLLYAFSASPLSVTS